LLGAYPGCMQVKQAIPPPYQPAEHANNEPSQPLMHMGAYAANTPSPHAAPLHSRNLAVPTCPTCNGLRPPRTFVTNTIHLAP